MLDPEALFADLCSFVQDQAVAPLDWPALSEAVAAWQQDDSRLVSLLPVYTTVAAGGTVKAAMPLAAAWLLTNLAGDIFDDIQDQDKDYYPWHRWPAAQAMTVGLALLGSAQTCLATLPSDAYQAISAAWASTLSLAAKAQWQAPTHPDEAAYFSHITAKSGLVLAQVVWAGARLQTETPELLQAAHDYGLNLGLVIQIWDDCRDLYPTRFRSNLLQGDYSLPMIYALSQQDNPNHAQLVRLLESDSRQSQSALDKICHLLEKMGAINYSLAMAHLFVQKALHALSHLPDRPATDTLRNYVCQFNPIAPDLHPA